MLPAEIARHAPGILDRAFLFRPVMAEPALCTMVDLKKSLTLGDVCDLHEVLDLKAAMVDKATAQANRKREADKRR